MAKYVIDIDEDNLDNNDIYCIVANAISLEKVLADLPVTPTRKKGKWIMTNDYFTGAYGNIDYVKCSCCGEDSLEEGDYCPNCGAYMREVEE